MNDDTLRWYRSTFGPTDRLPDWLVERDTLANTRHVVRRLRQARSAAAKASRPRRQAVTPVVRSPRRPVIRYAAMTTPTPVRHAATSGWHYSARSGVLTSVNSAPDGPVRLFGYAALWDRLSVRLQGFRERIAKGAFANTIQEVRSKNHAVLAYLEHDHRLLLGKTGVNLELREDTKGLAFELTLPDTTHARDAAELVRRGVVSGMSFGFMTRADDWDRKGSEPVRILRDVLLLEVSVVGSPAYPATAVHTTRGALDATSWQAVYMRALSQRSFTATETAEAAARSVVQPGGIERR